MFIKNNVPFSRKIKCICWVLTDLAVYNILTLLLVGFRTMEIADIRMPNRWVKHTNSKTMKKITF
jgi:hypothetical protein